MGEHKDRLRRALRRAADAAARAVERRGAPRPSMGAAPPDVIHVAPSVSGEQVLFPKDPTTKERKGFVESVREASEQSARKVLTEAFDQKKSDLEELAVRALRRAIEEEGERLERLIEKSIQVKKREVRLSLLVLLGATALYVLLALCFG